MLSLYFWLITTLLFFFGASIGSFLNVLIYRSANEEDWKKGRSRCDHCKKKIAWYDNVPLFSFLILRGKCRSCKKSIAISHFVVELLTGALFVWWYWFGFFFFRLSQEPFIFLQPIFWLCVGILLLVIFIADWRYYIIPDGAVIGLLSAAVLYRLALVSSGVMRWEDFFAAAVTALAATLFFLGLWIYTKGAGMGFGDVKLIGPLCLLMGWPRALSGLFLAFFIGALVGLLLIGLGRKKLKQPIPFGPFLILGTVISLMWGDALIAWYLGLIW